jgi:hypothetical protein
MAIATTDYAINEEDGWVKIATNPALLIIKADEFRSYRMAFTPAGAPAATLRGMLMGNDRYNSREVVVLSVAVALVAEVYVKVQTASADVMHFAVITG